MISRAAFLSAHFPLLAYCEYKRAPSTRFHESLHVENTNKNITVNILWRDDETVSLSVFDSNELDKRKQNTCLIQHGSKVNMKDIVDKFVQVMA